jgi:hypothetical protein
MTRCPITFDQLIRDHLQFGWQRLKHVFKSNRRIAKMRVVQPGDRATLSLRMVEMLTSARTFLVEYLFQCYNRSRHTTYTAFGSTALFSDYDITLLGQDAPELMLQMFNRFVEQYQNTLASALDTNIYCTGYFSSRNSRAIPERLLLPNHLMALQPVTARQERQCLTFAAMKLPRSNAFTTPAFRRKYPCLSQLLETSRVVQARLDDRLNRFDRVVPLAPPVGARYSPETRSIIRRYTLYALHAKQLYRMLYRSSQAAAYSSDELFQWACMSNYYAIEAYYTPCTVNVVVLEQQGKQRLSLKPVEYVCAVLENLGDWNTHHLHYTQDHKQDHHSQNVHGLIMLSLSKYLFRMYRALGQLPGAQAPTCRKLARDIERRILVFKHEAQPNYSEIPFSIIGYRLGQSMDACVRFHTQKAITLLEPHLRKFGLDDNSEDK